MGDPECRGHRPGTAPHGAGTLRRELLGRLLILGERHSRAVLTDYQAHYNTARPNPIFERDGFPWRFPKGKVAFLANFKIMLHAIHERGKRLIPNGSLRDIGGIHAQRSTCDQISQLP